MYLCKDLFYFRNTISVKSVVWFNCVNPFFSLLCRFTDDTFIVDNAVTIGVDFKMKKITVDNNNIKLALWVSN